MDGHEARADASALEDDVLIDLDTFLPYRLSVLANSVSRILAQLYEDEFQITTAEWRLLAILARIGPISANGVCQRTAMDKVRVSRAVARSQASGLINRDIDPIDRRRSVLSLTDKGREVHDRIVPEARAREGELMSALTEQERVNLLASLRKLQARANGMGPTVLIDTNVE